MRLNNKGPKRKLKLELIEGKSYLTRRDILHYYRDSGWNISDFMVHFKIGHRIVRRSITKYLSVEDRSILRGKKTRTSQLKNNSNSVNWYKPRNVIELDTLKEAISSSKNQAELMEKLGITKYILTSNLQYHNLPLPSRSTPGSLSLHDLTDKDLVLIKSLAPLHKELSLILSDNPTDIANGTVSLADLVFELRLLSRKIRRYNRNILKSHKVKFPANLMEYCFKEALKELGISYKMQVKLGNRYFDFLLEDKLIVELDGQLHTKIIDREKDDLAKSNGYNIVRLPLKKLGLIRFKQTENFTLCIKKYVLPVLNQ